LHESWTGSGPFGPGQPGYESQLRAENAAFGTFFTQLAAHGITRANTLFVITADEGDHFAGSAATPSGCNGVKVICHYSRIGEVNGNLTTLLAAKGITTPFDVNGRRLALDLRPWPAGPHEQLGQGARALGGHTHRA